MSADCVRRSLFSSDLRAALRLEHQGPAVTGRGIAGGAGVNSGLGGLRLEHREWRLSPQPEV